MKTFRLGVFGGTFDPVHLGHLQLAHQAISVLSLSQLLFVPAAQPPHKHSDITPVEHRIAMLELVCRSNARLSCSDIECQLPKPSYTIDTLRELIQRHSIDSEIFFIIGVDAFLDLRTWKSFGTILSMVEIVVSPRFGYSEKLLFHFLRGLGYSKKNGVWLGAGKSKNITILPDFPKDACSSMVRKAVAKGEGTSHILHPDVASYIKENCLYNM